MAGGGQVFIFTVVSRFGLLFGNFQLVLGLLALANLLPELLVHLGQCAGALAYAPFQLFIELMQASLIIDSLGNVLHKRF